MTNINKYLYARKEQQKETTTLNEWLIVTGGTTKGENIFKSYLKEEEEKINLLQKEEIIMQKMMTIMSVWSSSLEVV